MASTINILPLDGTGLNIGPLGFNGSTVAITIPNDLKVYDANGSLVPILGIYAGGFTQVSKAYYGAGLYWEYNPSNYARYATGDAYDGPKIYDTPGTYYYTVPAGVNNIAISAIGGGGGGWSSGASTISKDGGDTQILNNSGQSVAIAHGGKRASSAYAGTNVGGSVTIGQVALATYYTQQGATGSEDPPFYAGGGGGAGQVYYNKSVGTRANGSNDSWNATGGDGASLFGAGAEFTDPFYDGNTGSNNIGGKGGSYGGGGGGGRDGAGGGGGGMFFIENLYVTPGDTITVIVGAGGVGTNNSSDPNRSGGTGGDGAVAIAPSTTWFDSYYVERGNKRLLHSITSPQNWGLGHPTYYGNGAFINGDTVFTMDYDYMTIGRTTLGTGDTTASLSGSGTFYGLDYALDGSKVMTFNVNTGLQIYNATNLFNPYVSFSLSLSQTMTVSFAASFRSFQYSRDGMMLYVAKSTTGMDAYEMDSPYYTSSQLGGASKPSVQNLNVGGLTSFGVLWDFKFSYDGTQIIALGEYTFTGEMKIVEINLSTAWDISTAYSIVKEYDIPTAFQTNSQFGPKGIAFRSDNEKMYLVSNRDSKLYGYTLDV